MKKTITKPFAQSCVNNQQAILDILAQVFIHSKHVLEIGSGTGQHAVFFAPHLSHLTWQTSDLPMNHQGINLWLDEAALANVERPVNADLNSGWPTPHSSLPVDGIFTANTLHIISWPLVVKFFDNFAENLPVQGSVCIYGPFNYQGKFTSESNAKFDLWLKDRDKNSGIRDFEAILQLANLAGLELIDDHTMPANNRLLVFAKVSK